AGGRDRRPGRVAGDRARPGVGRGVSGFIRTGAGFLWPAPVPRLAVRTRPWPCGAGPARVGPAPHGETMGPAIPPTARGMYGAGRRHEPVLDELLSPRPSRTGAR